MQYPSHFVCLYRSHPSHMHILLAWGDDFFPGENVVAVVPAAEKDGGDVDDGHVGNNAPRDCILFLPSLLLLLLINCAHRNPSLINVSSTRIVTLTTFGLSLLLPLLLLEEGDGLLFS